MPAAGPGPPGSGPSWRPFRGCCGSGSRAAYPGLAKSRIALAALGVIYVLSPVDAMPELLIGVFGLGDDAFVTAWVVGALLGETDAFLRWEAARGPRVVVGQVVR